MLRGIRKQISLVDRSMLWLKELYIQLFYENGGCEPLASDAIRVCEYFLLLEISLGAVYQMTTKIMEYSDTTFNC